MKTISDLLTVILTLIILLSTSISHADETTFELQKKIKSDLSKIEKTDQVKNEKTKKLNKEIKKIVTKLTNTIDENEKEELGKKYFKKRAEHVKATAEWVVDIIDALQRISKNMSLLEREMNRPVSGDSAKGLSHSDISHIKGTLRGTANILSLLQKLKTHDPRINNMARMLSNLDMRYKRHFRSGGDIDLNRQIAYIEDLHAYMNSVKLLLRQETNHLKENVYYMMKDGMVRVIREFQKQFYSPDFKGFEDAHEVDDRVLSDRDKSENEEYYAAPDLNNIGNW